MKYFLSCMTLLLVLGGCSKTWKGVKHDSNKAWEKTKEVSSKAYKGTKNAINEATAD